MMSKMIAILLDLKVFRTIFTNQKVNNKPQKTQSFSNCDIYENLNEFLQKNNPQHTALVIFNVKNASNLLSKKFQNDYRL